MKARLLSLIGLAAAVGCSSSNNTTDTTAATAGNAPSATSATQQLSSSSRHGEWVVVKTSPNDSVRAWLVYPERREKAAVVVVVHEIFGLSNWVRSVADQLAADGFIAIAPDLLTMKNIPNDANGEPERQAATAAIRTLDPAAYQRDIRKAAEFAMNLPAATKKYGVVGYCWGGSAVFNHAIFYPDVNAVVSYYGTTPAASDQMKGRLKEIKAPVLGLYGGNDARVNATIAPMDSAAKVNGTTYEHHIFAGAGHGFLRAQDGAAGANLKASQEAWPLTVNWFRRYLGSSGHGQSSRSVLTTDPIRSR
jgi:carboxymethylenebutenolidase